MKIHKFLEMITHEYCIFRKKRLFSQHTLFLYVCKQTFCLAKMRTSQKLKVSIM